MDTTDLTQQLDDLVEHNRIMLENAEAGNWDKVVEQEHLRRHLITALYATPNISNSPDLANATQQMFEINSRMHQLVLNARDTVKNQEQSLAVGRIAVTAYAKNTR